MCAPRGQKMHGGFRHSLERAPEEEGEPFLCPQARRSPLEARSPPEITLLIRAKAQGVVTQQETTQEAKKKKELE